jgi:hypothetical protein
MISYSIAEQIVCSGLKIAELVHAYNDHTRPLSSFSPPFVPSHFFSPFGHATKNEFIDICTHITLEMGYSLA